MKAKVVKLTKEGFLTSLVLVMESGLMLQTFTGRGSLVWEGQRKTDEIVRQFNEHLDQLEACGWEIDRSALENENAL